MITTQAYLKVNDFQHIVHAFTVQDWVRKKDTCIFNEHQFYVVHTDEKCIALVCTNFKKTCENK